MTLARFFKRPPSGPEGFLPDGQRVYAIGDVHGRLDLLQSLLKRVEEDDRERGAADTHIVFLGDLIDRGPDSAQVISFAIELASARPNVRFLMGNHEEVFLEALAGDLKALAFFNRIGGRETILSYGVSPEAYEDADYPQLLDLLEARVPREHMRFLDQLEDLIIFGDYAFVHAGIRPGIPLNRQRKSDLRWIRNEFLGCRDRFEKIVVHGHSISDNVELLSNRIGLDTGAYASNRLSAMGFEADRRWVLDTVGAPGA